MTKQFYILMWVLFGFFINPTLSLAQGITSSEFATLSCCTDSDTSLMACCQDMDQGCQSLDCKCPTVNFVVSLEAPLSYQVWEMAYFGDSFFYTNHITSSGFSRIWLPPKIA